MLVNEINKSNERLYVKKHILFIHLVNLLTARVVLNGDYFPNLFSIDKIKGYGLLLDCSSKYIV